jgi:catechol 2,3-dioxygenase-like lactoylglutathione lyase family enzyme
VDRFVLVIKSPTFDASVRFYRDVLGLELEEEWHDAGHGATFTAGGPARVELLDLPDEPRPAPDDATFIGIQLADIDAVHGRAVAEGVEIVREPADRPWGGRGFVMRDPNGIAFNVYTAYDSNGAGDGDKPPD